MLELLPPGKAVIAVSIGTLVPLVLVAACGFNVLDDTARAMRAGWFWPAIALAHVVSVMAVLVARAEPREQQRRD